MTRERSNALAGPNDPRVPADKQLAALFATSIPVAQELEGFLKIVYGRKDLMTWNDLAHADDDRLADHVYELYTSSGSGAKAVEGKAAAALARRVWGQIDKLIGGRADVTTFFQYSGWSLQGVLASKSDAKVLRACNDFLYFRVNQLPVAYRVYLNLDFGSMPDLVASVLGLDKSLADQVSSFKICGPGGVRADSVVIYCKGKEAAEGIAARMAELIKKGKLTSTNQSVPAMTTRIAPGVAIGAEPAKQATGLGAKPEGYGEDAQSFGSIRSELIAGAIFNYQDNLRTLGNTFNTFRQLVAIAFKGYGLDPARPGN
jgi:HopA1 effector protein family